MVADGGLYDKMPRSRTQDTREGSSSEPATIEALACVTCRARKLKCDRRAPICTRCERANNACVYPETRRKPAFKRRNVKELEERLAQVEGVLKNASLQLEAGKRAETGESGSSPGSAAEFDFDTFFSGGENEGIDLPSASPPGTADGGKCGELVGLGRWESLPPPEMIEELYVGLPTDFVSLSTTDKIASHEIYFQTQPKIVPFIHKQTYLQAYHSASYPRPPMCLQYALWTIASNIHEKYERYSDVFYRRARHYLEADELKDAGEHFITIAHAQSWTLIATYEFRKLFLTRFATSVAKVVRLVHVMGLHRLDDDSGPDGILTPTIPAPRSWLELENRRRVFWAAFCIDAHGCITTGWPSLIDLDEITTHLPASEEAFQTGKEEKSNCLQDVLQGGQYSTFAGIVVNSHLFKKLVSHINRAMPSDRPHDLAGPFWKRHRNLDDMLSNVFMFLPERFRLPRNMDDPTAVRANLNLHGAAICLHNTAWSIGHRFNLPDELKQASKVRALASAQEIVNIIKMVGHLGDIYTRALTTPALYCAAAAYIHQASENPDECAVENLEYLIGCIALVGYQDYLSLGYLNQLRVDVKETGLLAYLNLPVLEKPPADGTQNIPLRDNLSHDFARPLLARLPLSRRTGNTIEHLRAWENLLHDKVRNRESTEDIMNEGGNKRKRTDAQADTLADNWFEECAPYYLDPMSVARSIVPVVENIMSQVNLPHRGTNRAGSSSAMSGRSTTILPEDKRREIRGQQENFMTFVPATAGRSPAPPHQPTPVTFADTSSMYLGAEETHHIHQYTGFMAEGSRSQIPQLELGIGLFPGSFRGLEEWGPDMDDIRAGAGPSGQQQQHQLYDAASAAASGDPWAALDPTLTGRDNGSRARGGSDPGGSGHWRSAG
ncbi:fungal-specific transcription factor domain-containing protein [Apodospora peruviana]|uniref:Fungal-specific transcription factor domain-containing protein n=1 Tax=Apodospora peruviana TaxID=516989 RepID=A0AAE0ICE6_9PEZI|nr:fungal-specific transcription factor domain-containing protein [Apodospora peruviana]